MDPAQSLESLRFEPERRQFLLAPRWHGREHYPEVFGGPEAPPPGP